MPDPNEPACVNLREMLNRIGDKWSVLVIATLGEGPQRFGELKRAIDGISQRMLTQTLRQLERDGIVSRSVYPTIPPRVDYALTPLGMSSLRAIQSLAEWAVEHGEDVAAARARYDALHLDTVSAFSPRATRR
ncbi:MAG: transcriptional regulator [Dehalococcoidia bacterium]|nr:MAG: transcriptional regulator [Dehalococcoidia bacterium]